MQNQQIVDYIRQRLQLGHAELDIRRELERTGWPRAEIQTGWETDDGFEVKSGLKKGERIVVSGNFLLDSESRVQGCFRR